MKEIESDQQQEEEKAGGKQPRSNEQSQEESSKEEEEKKNKGDGLGGNLDININIQRDKKNLDGANNCTISRNEEMLNVLDGRETLIHHQPQPCVSLTSEPDSTYMNLQDIVNLDEDDFNFTFDPEEILLELNGSQDKPGEGPLSVEMDPVPLLGSSGSGKHGQPTPNPQLHSRSDIGEDLIQDERESTKPVSFTLPINQGQGILKVHFRNPQLEPPRLHSPSTSRFKWLHKPGRFLRIPSGITQRQLNSRASLPPDLHHTISTEDFRKSEEDRNDEANNKKLKK